MKIFANRSIWKKIVIIFSLIFSMSFVEPAPVEAGIGGTLMEPICDLLIGFGDGVMGIFQNVLIGQETTYIRVNRKSDLVRKIITGIVVIIALAVAGFVIGGVVLPIAGLAAAKLGLVAIAVKTSIVIGSIVPVALGATYVGTMAYNSDWLADETVLPMYSLSPEQIFSDTYPIFDVNFFNPNSDVIKYQWIHKYDESDVTEERRSVNGKYEKVTSEEEAKLNFSNSTDVTDQYRDEFKYFRSSDNRVEETVTRVEQIIVDGKKYIKVHIVQNTGTGDATDVHNIEEIRRVPDTSGTSEEGNGSSASTEGERKALDKVAYTKELQNIVKFWYNIVRTLAIVSMMSVLVYIGIRILLSSTSEQKAKYKELMTDWLVGMVLLFTMQYIMVFANIAVEHLTDLFKSINPMGQIAYIPDNNGKIQEELRKYNFEFTETQGDDARKIYVFTDSAGDTYIEWHTDLMGQLRIAVQNGRGTGEEYIGYTIMFLVMVIYTFIFCFIYIKRVLYMAFLTVISPLVALTYPIDKVNDGSAQGFNYWFKEYIFNLLLQPIHLLIYTILVSSAVELATKNMIYSLVALGFITQAEKIVRQMFNFSKASTPGVFSGAAGAAMAMTGMRWLMGHGPKGSMGGQKNNGTSGGTSNSDNGGKLRTKDDKNSFNSSNNRSILIGSEGGLGENSGGQGNSNGVFNGIGESAEGASGNEPGSLSFLERMRDAELEETPYIPDNEQLQMLDNDARYENSDGGMTYSDDEYLQILKESGASDEEIAQIMGETSGSTIQDNTEQIEMETESGTENTIEENKSGLRNAIGAVATAYGEGMTEKIARGLLNAKPGRAIGGAIGAAALGTIGVAAGVASGDLKSVVTDGVAGVAGGYKLGSGLVNSATNALSVDGLGEEFQKAYYGEEKVAELNRKQKATSKENIDKVMEKYNIKSRKEAKEKAEKLSEYWRHDDKLEFDHIIKLDKAKDDVGLPSTLNNKEKIIVQANSDINKYGIANIKGDKDRLETAKQFNLDHPELKLTEKQALAYIDRLRKIHNKIND